MAKFCDKCGTKLPDTSSFCLACGAPAAAMPPAAQPPAPAPSYPPAPTPADFQPVQTPPAYLPPPQAYTPPQQAAYQAPPQTPPQAYQPPPQTPPQAQWSAPQSAPAAPLAQVAQTTKSSNTLLKVVLVIVVILGLGAVAVVGGLWYVGHKVVNRVKDAAAQAGIDTDDLGKQATTKIGDPCRFLSKEEVGNAIGVTITETKSSPDGCSYFAKGDMADMTSKHVAAMLGQRGADQKTQQMAQQFAGIIGSSQPKSSDGEQSDATGNAVVLGVSFQTQSAREQMKIDSKVLGAFGQAGGSSDLSGIGDEASVAADGMLMMRKGDTMVRFTYTSCPCSTEAIKPLAKKVADAL